MFMNTATRELRSMGYTQPIFGVTGNGLKADVEHFMSSGVDNVLLKPLNLTDFYQVLKPLYVIHQATI